MKYGLIGWLLALLVAPAAAQPALDCAARVRLLVETARLACAETGLNEACYGGGLASLDGREGADEARFAAPGDKVPLGAVKTLRVGAGDEVEGWGVALLRLRANLPDGAVTLLAVGAVTVDNLSDKGTAYVGLPVTVRERTGANVRLRPSPNAEIIAQLPTGQTLLADGRLADGSWVRLLSGGWVAAALLRPDDRLADLEVTAAADYPPADRSAYAPMQRLRFRSQPAADCPDEPGGLIAQTPDAASPVTLSVNGLETSFAGTLWFRTGDGDSTMVAVLEGGAVHQGAPLSAGQQVEYAYNGRDIQQLAPPADYAYVQARRLPLTLLPRPVELPFSLGGVVFPYAAGSGFLNNIPAEAACTAVWAVDVNLRAGPGREYPIRRGVPGGYYGRPEARAQGTDGQLWWRLAEGIWVQAANTAAAGACGSLPLVEPPPIPAR